MYDKRPRDLMTSEHNETNADDNRSVNRTTPRVRYTLKGDEQEKSRDRNYERTRRFQGRIAGNKVMF